MSIKNAFGVEHILFGIDHLLFVFCLLLLIDNRKQLFGAITAFTLTHSITLASTMLGWVHFASAPVEALIALSIAFLAAEIVQVRNGIIHCLHWLAVFGFGLLHGFGFAAALREIGLFEESVAIALLLFNLGIEFGQILFVICIIGMWRLKHKYVPNLLPLPLKFIPFSIGVVASYWFLERAIAIF